MAQPAVGIEEWLAMLSDGEAVVRLSHLYSYKVDSKVLHLGGALGLGLYPGRIGGTDLPAARGIQQGTPGA